MRIYLSGPMTGVPNHNRPAFDAAAKRLREQGHFVINPHELTEKFGSADDIAESFRWLWLARRNVYDADVHLDIQTRLAAAVMDADLAAVRSCDAIYLLKGWEDSRGAKKELAEAIKNGLKIMQEGVET